MIQYRPVSSDPNSPDGPRDTGELSSLEKGLLILRALGSTPDGMIPSELSAVTGLNRSTTYRLCEILESEGWIHRQPAGPGRSGRVIIGAATLGLSILVNTTFDTNARLQPMIDGLAASVSEAVHVGVREHAQIVHIARATPSASGMRVAAELGSREAAHATALGKALLATLSDDDIVRLFPDPELPTRTHRTISTRADLLAEMARIRSHGFAIDDQESSLGVKCVAAPVIGPDGLALFALSVTTTPARLDRGKLETVIEAVRASAALVSTSFGGSTTSLGWGAASGNRGVA
jgi:DNA-binding IclR family transcriptional regulator